ncbi:hypothetical protein N5E99_18985 [Pseudomonas chengduensis]|uniref:Uncharacterized protein n=1 Tax=Ectopseudomonas chengduensis TaxID=489632 RepID=A0A1G6TSL2_9GAMM|nr:MULTISPECIES: hypothetical protein [Pseudomonas]MDH0957627.1 hypothetical protein [Pseudomonas chengduensis]MDH1537841.1 hypothetical protein [Pseudomonas chengduensis]MDH1620312.1 hypothetical protein [Pseudomonas chengduensis]SDD32060.1 hypothetical protein SAMN05216576_11483 [Pseudomonas chengduensis]
MNNNTQFLISIPFQTAWRPADRGLMTACSNYQDKDYQGNWAPETMTPYDLPNNTPDAPVVYFATTRYRALGVPFHRLLLATLVDGQQLPGAAQSSMFPASRLYG